MRPRHLILTTILAGSAGCSGLQRPSFRALAAEAGNTTADGVELVFVIEATNNNSDPLPLRSAEYKLAIDGATVFEGIRSPEATVPPFGTQTFRLPAVVPSEDLPAGGTGRYEISGSVRYQEPGRLAEILFDQDVRRPKARIRVGGGIDFSGEN